MEILRSYLLLSCFLLIGISASTQDVNSIIDRYEACQEAQKSDNIWPTYNEADLKAEHKELSAILSSLREVDMQNATTDDKINADLLKLIIEDVLFQIDFKSHEMPLSAEGGFLAGIIYSITGSRISDKKSEIKYLNKLKELPDYIDSMIGLMRQGQSRGVSSPKLIATLCLGMVQEITQASPDDNFFVKTAKGSRIEDKVIAISVTHVVPAYKALESFLLEEYIPNAPKEIGVRNIEGGEEYYKQRIRYYATEDISPEAVFQKGMEEVRRIRQEMETIIASLEFEGSFEEFCTFLRTDPQFYPKSKKELLHYAAWITKEMEGKLPQYFTKLPMMPLTVKPVPEALAPNYTTGRYSPGSYKNKKAGQYWVNTTKLESRPLYVLPSLSLHEGVPGHHTQIMLSAEMDLPDFRRNQYLSAFGEGWALYCEYLGKEAGMYHTPYEDFGRLVYEMWRACRLVVDPGMHYMGWSREKAFNFMKDNTALSLHEVGTEINRYIGWPGQAVSYKLGELKIRELRAWAESEMGEDFDIRAFHDKILENGSIPMNTLEKVVKSSFSK